MKYIASDKFILKKVPKNPIFIPIEGTNISMTTIYNTNELGVFIYELIKNGLDDNEIANEIVGGYDVDLERAKNDLQEFLNDLEAKGIIIRS